MDTARIAFVWEQGPVEGSVAVVHGTRGKMWSENGIVDNDRFTLPDTAAPRLEVEITDAMLEPGAGAARVTLDCSRGTCTLFARDVSSAHPVLVPSYGVAVTTADDTRTFADIAQARQELTRSALLAPESEESYESAAEQTRHQRCPTWLGVGRDLRLFEIHYEERFGFWGYVQPRYHSVLPRWPETGEHPCRLRFAVGAGASCRVDITRRLEDGVLPILHSTQTEGDMTYDVTAFATLESGPLTEPRVAGTDWQVCYANTGGNMTTPEQGAAIEEACRREMYGRDEEVLCWIRVEAVNRGAVPRYAWFKGVYAEPQRPGVWEAEHDSTTGATRFLSSGRVVCLHRLNGVPAPQAEVAVLVAPGERAVYDYLVPHQPLPPDRAAALAELDFDAHLDACRRYWRKRLSRGAAVHLPEKAIDERVDAGLLHCDLVTLGRSTEGPLLPTIGWYAPIGSESAPIIQFFDSMGWHDMAERSLQFFLERQFDNGFMQNFGGYQLETGPVLWSMGEHYRYTRDSDWVRRVTPHILKACDYLLQWRERNCIEGLRGAGYGLLDGKVADPEDFFHSYMLNGLSYLGLSRAAEMLQAVDHDEAGRLASEAAAFREDIRTACEESMGRSPVIPLDDGTWVPTVPPWTEYPGPVALYAEGGGWFTHGTFSGRDSLLGPLCLVQSEVFGADEPIVEAMLNSHRQLFTLRNAGLSQPYYCRHDHVHLCRGEVDAFLQTYYNQLAGLQDRETYTFWEHYYGVSQHKTHEEGWFLMQTRWMLWMEQGDALALLPGVPRAWLNDGNTIALDSVASYFGPVSVTVQSALDEGVIRATVTCATDRRPASVRIRLPHPQKARAASVHGGAYDALKETVTVGDFTGTAEVELQF